MCMCVYPFPRTWRSTLERTRARFSRVVYASIDWNYHNSFPLSLVHFALCVWDLCSLSFSFLFFAGLRRTRTMTCWRRCAHIWGVLGHTHGWTSLDYYWFEEINASIQPSSDHCLRTGLLFLPCLALFSFSLSLPNLIRLFSTRPFFPRDQTNEI